MNIGESLLDYYTEQKILKSKSTNILGGKFYTTVIRDSNFKNYEAVEIFLETNDNNLYNSINKRRDLL